MRPYRPTDVGFVNRFVIGIPKGNIACPGTQ